MKSESTIDQIPIVSSGVSVAPRVGGGLLARNSLINLLAQAVPLILGVVSIPVMVSHLGTARFGLLSLWWVLLGNTSVVDLGLGRATTMFVAEALAEQDRNRLSRVIWTSVSLQTLVGITVGVLIASTVPFFLQHVLRTPLDLMSEGRISFMIFAGILGVALPAASFRGALEATQRFDLVCLVKGPLNSSMFLLPLLVIAMHGSLIGIAVVLAAAVGLACVAYLCLCLYLLPEIRHVTRPTRNSVASLAHYAGWVSVSNFVSPILAYADRFFIGSFLGLTAVAYYSAPYDAVTRLWILPSSISSTLFPAFTTLRGRESQNKLNAIYARSLKYLLLCIGPLVLVITIYAEDILRMWLGLGFAARSTWVLQLLAVGVLVNSLGWVPFSLLQGQGRPDLTAKFHLLELPFHLVLLSVLLMSMGIMGAALAWTLRVVVDAALVFVACKRLRLAHLSAKDTVVLLTLLLLIICSIPIVRLGISRSTVILGLGSSFILVAWRYLLNPSDRIWFMARFSQFGFSRGQ